MLSMVGLDFEFLGLSYLSFHNPLDRGTERAEKILELFERFDIGPMKRRETEIDGSRWRCN